MNKKQLDAAIKKAGGLREKLEAIASYSGRLCDYELLQQYGIDRKHEQRVRKIRKILEKEKEKEFFDSQYKIFSSTCNGVSKKMFVENIKSAWAYKSIVDDGTKLSFKKFIDNLPYSRSFSKEWGVSFDKFIKMKKNAEMILGIYRNNDYSMGAITKLFVYSRSKKNKKFFSEYDDRESYAKSCTWKPTHGYTEIVISLNDLLKIENIDGVLTVKGNDHKCKWITSSGKYGNYEVYFEHGYIWHKSHGKTLEEAKELHRKRKIAEAKKKMSNHKLFDRFKYRFIGIDHLKNAGACDPGINSAVYQLGIDLNSVGGIRVDYLLEIAKDRNIDNLVKSWLRIVL